MSGRMDSSGISTVVGLILVLGLIVSVAAVIKIAYIPDVKKQLEADHMQHVIADFSSFKTQLDMDQAASAATGVGYAASASVEMGGGAIPGIDPSTSHGTLSLDPSYGQLTITAYDSMPPNEQLDLGTATALGRLAYQSNNRFYADQNLSYECGMVMLSQPGGSIMLAPPSLTVTADPHVAGRPVVSFNALRLSGTAQSFSSGGTGTIRTWLIPGSTAYASTNVTNVTFTIVSNYASQWYDYLDSMLATSGLATDNYALSRPDANTVILKVNGTGSQHTGLFLADSSFGTAMGYSTTPPSLATPTPTLTPTPTPTPAPGQTIAAASLISNNQTISQNGQWTTYRVTITLTVNNNGMTTANAVQAAITPPATDTSSGPREIQLISGPSINPQDIGPSASVTYVWVYQFEIRSGRAAIFSLTAQGTNTNLTSTTATYSSP